MAGAERIGRAPVDPASAEDERGLGRERRSLQLAPETLDAIPHRRAQAERVRIDVLGHGCSRGDGRVGAEEDDAPTVRAHEHAEHEQAELVSLAGSAGQDSRAADSVCAGSKERFEPRPHLGAEDVFLGDAQLPGLPALAGFREQRRDHVRKGAGNVLDGEGLVEQRPDGGQIGPDDRVVDGVPKLCRRLRRLERAAAEHRSRLADPVALAQPLVQPFDPAHVDFGVAAVTAGRTRRAQHSVPLLPLAQGVRGDAGPPRDGGNVQVSGHPGQNCDSDAASTLAEMPEGDSLARAARRLQVLVGERLEVEAPHPRAAVKRVAERLDGRRLLGVEALGKNLLLRFEDGIVLRSHLRMSGRWTVRPRSRPHRGRARPWLVLRGAEREALLWNGPVLELEDRAVRRLGPDILDEPLELEAIVSNFRREPMRAMGDALLDQRLVAGIGNLWKAEALWEARVSPWRRIADVSDDELRKVLEAAHELMSASVKTGRERRVVYNRAGRGCRRCGRPIRARGQGDDNRTAYWCPTCQAGEEPRSAYG
jgi:endonuclease VIII